MSEKLNVGVGVSGVARSKACLTFRSTCCSDWRTLQGRLLEWHQAANLRGVWRRRWMTPGKCRRTRSSVWRDRRSGLPVTPTTTHRLPWGSGLAPRPLTGGRLTGDVVPLLTVRTQLIGSLLKDESSFCEMPPTGGSSLAELKLGSIVFRWHCSRCGWRTLTFDV